VFVIATIPGRNWYAHAGRWPACVRQPRPHDGRGERQPDRTTICPCRSTS